MIDCHEILRSNMLFLDLDEQNIEIILSCLGARKSHFRAGQTAIWEGDAVNDIGIVLSGRGRTEKTAAGGRVFIMSLIEPGSFVGVLLAASRTRKSPVSVRAETDMSLLFIPFDKIVTRCEKACPRHDIFLRNCFDAIAGQSLALHDRIDCLIRPTVREKVLAYLSRVSRQLGGKSFLLPLDRAAMADYLNVERSALSRELSNMKRDGLIDYYKSSFKLLK